MADDSIFALKRQLADEILALTHDAPVFSAGRRLGIDESRVCVLRHGRIARFSLERLIRILAEVNRGVKLTIVPTGPERVSWFRGRPRVRRLLRTDRAESGEVWGWAKEAAIARSDLAIARENRRPKRASCARSVVREGKIGRKLSNALASLEPPPTIR